jgi:hypothetical protein
MVGMKLPTSALPLQRIETIDEPRDREKAAQGSLFDHAEFSAKAHRDDFRNMLIWGDNKLTMASLLERYRGKIDLIYIDPPFDVGADFTMQVQIGEEGEALQKEQSILEAVAYRDTWGKGTDSYLHLMMELQHKKQAVEAETGLTIRLKYIPREIMEPNRTECQFFEAGALEVKVLKRGGKSAEGGGQRAEGKEPKAVALRSKPSALRPIDVELRHFTPALAEAPEEEMKALRQRAVKPPFDFIDFWAVDFEWHPNKPFEHHWQDFRTRKDRSLKTKTDIGWEYQGSRSRDKTSGKKQICVKVIDVFGVDTTTVVEIVI